MSAPAAYGMVWKHKMEEGAFAMTPDGSRFAVGSDGHVCMLNDLGDLLWKDELEWNFVNDIYMTPDGSRVAAILGIPDHLYMLDGDGRLLWEFDEGDEDLSWDVAMTADGGRVAVLRDALYMLDGDGRLLWKFGEGDWEGWGTVAMTPDGSRVAAGDTDGHVYMLDGRGELMWKHERVDSTLR